MKRTWSKKIQKGTRNKIVLLLKKNKGLNSAQIGEKLGLHKVTVRQHLLVLSTQGYICHQKEKLKRGRPRNIYYLTSKGIDELFPRKYPDFSTGLIDAVLAIDGEKKIKTLLQREMEQRAAGFFEGSKFKPLDEKVRLLADFFNQQGYMVEVEETDDAFIFQEYHCALINIAEKYQQICQVEQSFLQDLLGLPIQRECHINSGDNCCSYRIPKIDKI